MKKIVIDVHVKVMGELLPGEDLEAAARRLAEAVAQRASGSGMHVKVLRSPDFPPQFDTDENLGTWIDPYGCPGGWGLKLR